jgi:hypothetical protein
MAYQHTNSKGKTYHLHARTNLVGAAKKPVTLHYFGGQPKEGVCDLPPGHEVVESPRTGLPMLKKKK